MTGKRLFLNFFALVLLLAALPALALAQDKPPTDASVQTPEAQTPSATDDDTPATAPLLQCGIPTGGVIGSAGDVDYYRIETYGLRPSMVSIKAWEVGSPLDAVLTLYGPDGPTVVARQDDFDARAPRLHWTPQTNASLPGPHDKDSLYYVKVANFSGGGGSAYTYSITYHVYPVYVGMTASGTVGGVSYEKGDILLADYNCQTGSTSWEMFFDASAAGVTGNVRDFAVLNGDPSVASQHGYILMSLDKQTIPGLGTVVANDLVAFQVNDVGADDTSGSFHRIFDGSDVGLTTKGEQIDGLTIFDNPLMLSPSGKGSVMNATFANEDILVFNPSQLGTTTSGSWALHFDGSNVGLGAVDTQGIHLKLSESDGAQFLYVTFDKTIQIGGTTVTPRDSQRCWIRTVGLNNTSCDWLGLQFFGSVQGLPATAVFDGYDEGGSQWWPAAFSNLPK